MIGFVLHFVALSFQSKRFFGTVRALPLECSPSILECAIYLRIGFMFKLSLVSLFTTSVLLAGSAYANGDKTVAQSATQSEVQTVQIHAETQALHKKAQGFFELENGLTLVIHSVNNQLFAQVNKEEKVEVFAMDGNTLVSKDQAVKVEFRQPQFARVNEVKLTYRSTPSKK